MADSTCPLFPSTGIPGCCLRLLLWICAHRSAICARSAADASRPRTIMPAIARSCDGAVRRSADDLQHYARRSNKREHSVTFRGSIFRRLEGGYLSLGHSPCSRCRGSRSVRWGSTCETSDPLMSHRGTVELRRATATDAGALLPSLPPHKRQSECQASDWAPQVRWPSTRSSSAKALTATSSACPVATCTLPFPRPRPQCHSHTLPHPPTFPETYPRTCGRETEGPNLPRVRGLSDREGPGDCRAALGQQVEARPTKLSPCGGRC